MEHHICKGGCKAISEKPGTCTARNCSKNGKPFEKCDCDDGLHRGALGPGPHTTPVRNREEK